MGEICRRQPVRFEPIQTVTLDDKTIRKRY